MFFYTVKHFVVFMYDKHENEKVVSCMKVGNSDALKSSFYTTKMQMPKCRECICSINIMRKC